MQRIVRSIGDRVLGAPEGASREQLYRTVEHGSTSLRIRAVRELGHRRGHENIPLLIRCLSDETPGVRRASAHALGHTGDAAVISHLLEVMERERADEHGDPRA